MVSHILRWLGVAELGRAQLVCRQWRDLIRDPENDDHSSGAGHVRTDSIADDLWRAAFLQTWPLPPLQFEPTSRLGSAKPTSDEEDDDDDDSTPSVRLADEEDDDDADEEAENCDHLGGCRWMQIARERWILQKKNAVQPRRADGEDVEEDAIAYNATKRDEKGFGDIVKQLRASLSELLEDRQQLTSTQAYAALSALATTVLYQSIKARYR